MYQIRNWIVSPELSFDIGQTSKVSDAVYQALCRHCRTSHAGTELRVRGQIPHWGLCFSTVSKDRKGNVHRDEKDKSSKCQQENV